MNTTVNAVLFKSKTLSNGAHPLMIRICQNNKKKYKSLGVSPHAQYWNFEKNKPKRNCPNKEQILKIIAEKIKAYREQILEFKASDKDFTTSTLIERVNKPIKLKTVKQTFDEQIERLFAEKRRGYALSHK